MQVLPSALVDAIEAFSCLPGVGPRTAERYAYYLVRHDPEQALQLARSAQHLNTKIAYCPKTFALISSDQK